MIWVIISFIFYLFIYLKSNTLNIRDVSYWTTRCYSIALKESPAGGSKSQTGASASRVEKGEEVERRRPCFCQLSHAAPSL